MADIAEAEKIIAARFSYGQDVIHRCFIRVSHLNAPISKSSSAVISASISLARSRSKVVLCIPLGLSHVFSPGR
jgi:hypothetical protein